MPAVHLVRRQGDILSGGGPAPTSTVGMSDVPGGDFTPTGGSSPPGATNVPPGGNTSDSGSHANPPNPIDGSGPTSSVSGSPGGNVVGPQDTRHGFSPWAITAILLGILLILAIVGVGLRLLWRRRLERRGSYHIEPVAAGASPRPGQGSFTFDRQMAERLRGGVIEPYNGAASAESLSSQYRIEPFAVPPPRRPAHARTASSTRLLADPAAFGYDNRAPSSIPPVRPEKQGLLPLPRGAMNLPHHAHTFSGLTPLATPMGSPASEGDIVFELPPTYASLAQPRPVRRWYQLWPSQPLPPPAEGSRGSRSSL